MFKLYKKQSLGGFTLLFILIFLLLPLQVYAQGFQSVTNLTSFTVSDNSGEKPQSKLWNYAGKWWTVMPNSSGSILWRLDGTSWTNVLMISSNTGSNADCKAVGGNTYILLFQGITSELVTVQYAYNTYTVSSTSSISLDTGAETAVLDIDGTGRMWISSAGTSDINVRWSDSPY